MNIIDKRTNNIVRFGDVEPGTIVESVTTNNLYWKINVIAGDCSEKYQVYNVIDLYGNTVGGLTDDDKVIIVDHDLILKGGKLI